MKVRWTSWAVYQLGGHLIPAGGASGEAYMAEQDGQKLFLKRNSNPFIAALSARYCAQISMDETHRNRRGCYKHNIGKMGVNYLQTK